MKKKKNLILKIFLMWLVLLACLVAIIIPQIIAYFTAETSKSGEISFADISLVIDSTNENSALFSADVTKVVPGDTLEMKNISVRNAGNEEIFSIINLNVYTVRAGYTDYNVDKWYNLAGEEINVKNMDSNTIEATKITVGESQSVDLKHTFDGNIFDNTFKNAKTTITLKAVGIQTKNLEPIGDIETDSLIATQMLVDDFCEIKASNVADLSQLETQTYLACTIPSETFQDSSVNYSLYNFSLKNANSGDTVYVQASNADQVAIIPGTYDLNSLDFNDLPAGSVQAFGQTVTTFTVPEQQTYKLTKSIVKTENVLPSDWDKTFTVGAITATTSTKKPTIKVYVTPQDDLPDIVDGLGVYKIDYADIKQTPSTFTIPMETMPFDEYWLYDVSNYIVSNITENSTVTICAYDAGMSLIAMDNMSLMEVATYIAQAQLPPNSVVRGYMCGAGQPCVYTFNVTAGTNLKFFVAGSKDTAGEEYPVPKVSVYVTPTGNLPGESNGVAYQLLEDGSGYSASVAHDFVMQATILDTFNGLPVKEIREDGFIQLPYLYSVSIGKNVETIGNSAFAYCTSLTEIEIPSSVTTIGFYAFIGCNNLSQVTFGANSQLTSIGERAFYSCAITSIEIPSSVTTIEGWAFYNCNKLSQVTFGANSQLTSIGDYAFQNCTSLTEIEIPSSVTSIGEWAFADCYTLSQVTIGANSHLTSIGSHAFAYCDNLTEIEIPSSVTSIGYYAFYNCTSLTTLTLNAKEGYVWAIYSSKWDVPSQDYVIDSLKVLNANSLSQAELIIYAKGQYIFKQVSNNADKLTYALSSDGKYYSVTNAPKDLTFVVIPAEWNNKAVKTIEYLAFYHCVSLTEIEIPSSVTTIQGDAFWNCTKLSTVTLNAKENYVWAIYNPNDDSLVVADASTLTQAELVSYAKNGRYFEQCYCADSVLYFLSSNGTYSVHGVETQTLTTVEIPSQINGIQVTSIRYSAFRNSTSLTEIEIPSSVTSIGEYAFYYCNSLTEIEIPSSVTTIEAYAFDDCSKLSQVTFGANSKLTSIGNYAFAYCTSLTEIEIPSSVTTIGSYAFYDCDSLTEIEIPSSVTTIGDGAFYSCDKLSQVTFGANSKLTSIGNYAFAYCTSLTEIEIPSSVTSIGTYAFNSCTSLTTFTLNAKEGYVWAIYSASDNSLVVADASTLTQTQLITYAKGNYNFKQVLKSE